MTKLFVLAVQHIRRRVAMSIAAIVLSAVMAAGVVTLIGDATQRANTLLQSLRDSKARSVVLRTSNPDKPVPNGTARALASLPGVELAIAFPPAESVSAPGLYDPNASIGYVTVDTLAGELPLRLTSGREPRFNEVMVSRGAAIALRMTQPLATGVVTVNGVVPIVGTFTLGDAGAISDLLTNTAIGPNRPDSDYSTMVFLAREPADVATITSAVNQLIADRAGMTLDYEPRAAAIERTVANAGRNNVASLALSIVLVGAIIQVASALLNAILQRRENARRRALGYTRRDVVMLGAIEATMLSVVGASLGTGAASLRYVATNVAVQPGQLFATIALLGLLAPIAAIPGATTAAFHDPARILRVP